MRRARTRDGDAGTRPFALFAECIVTGLWFTLAALPLVTIPAAAAAASRHLAAFVDGDPCRIGDFLRDFAAAWRTGKRAGLVVAAAVVLLAVDLVVLSVGGLPGQPVVAAVTLLAAGVGAVVLLRAAAAWTPGASWKDLARGAAAASRRDLGGTGMLLGGLAVLVACGLALWILVVPMSGCVIGAALAVHRRREETARA